MTRNPAVSPEVIADIRREQAAQCLRNATAAGRRNDLMRVHMWRAQAEKYADKAERLDGVYAD